MKILATIPRSNLTISHLHCNFFLNVSIFLENRLLIPPKGKQILLNKVSQSADEGRNTRGVGEALGKQHVVYRLCATLSAGVAGAHTK